VFGDQCMIIASILSKSKETMRNADLSDVFSFFLFIIPSSELLYKSVFA